jgi:hypothetical protein
MMPHIFVAERNKWRCVCVLHPMPLPVFLLHPTSFKPSPALSFS